MTREFPDELLSGYLDGELSADEQALVEQRLATSDADRQLLDELRSLRGDLATLPGVNIDSGFADRVVQAALLQAAMAAADGAPSVVIAPRSTRQTRRWMVAAAVLAAAASLMVAIQPWQYSSPNVPAVVMSPQEQLIRLLQNFGPTEGQALVVRLQVEDAAGSLDAALAQAGIETLVTGGATAVGKAYQQQVAEKLAAGSTAAAAALLVEAPLADIERALVAFAGEGKNRVNLLAETKLDWQRVTQGLEGEGEGDLAAMIASGKRSFAKHLDASQFPLSSSAMPAAAPLAAVPAPTAAGPVRLIILVEQIGPAR
jgi:anti-sigma factor RsiW